MTISWRRALMLLVVVGAIGPSEATAQQQSRRISPPVQRDTMEARVRQRMGQVIRSQLGLSEAQMVRLMETNRRFEVRRRELLQQERDVRVGLRDEIESGDTTRSAQIAILLDRMLVVQRQRIELIEAEQKELALFLTPIQRARFFGLEEQIQRRVNEMRDRGMNRPDPAAGARRPTPPPSVRRPPRG